MPNDEYSQPDGFYPDSASDMNLPDYVEDALYDAFSIVTIAICTQQEAEKANMTYFKVSAHSKKIRAYEQVACG